MKFGIEICKVMRINKGNIGINDIRYKISGKDLEIVDKLIYIRIVID